MEIIELTIQLFINATTDCANYIPIDDVTFNTAVDTLLDAHVRTSDYVMNITDVRNAEAYARVSDSHLKGFVTEGVSNNYYAHHDRYKQELPVLFQNLSSLRYSYNVHLQAGTLTPEYQQMAVFAKDKIVEAIKSHLFHGLLFEYGNDFQGDQSRPKLLTHLLHNNAFKGEKLREQSPIISQASHVGRLNN